MLKNRDRLTDEEIAERCADRLLGNGMDLTAFAFTVNLDPTSGLHNISIDFYYTNELFDRIVDEMAKIQRFNITMQGTGDCLSFDGFITQFEPSTMIEGEMPAATLDIQEVKDEGDPLYYDMRTGERVVI